jgi:prepilin-type N-terminal cleavage/methylation domain-containing protein
MATGEVAKPLRGFTLLEVMITVAICAILVAMAADALSGAQKVSRVAGEARFLVQRLQSVRTAAVSQGQAQGYFIGPNGLNVVAPNAHQAFVFFTQNPTASPVVYNPLTDRQDTFRDWLPISGTSSMVVVSGDSGAQPGPFSIGFDINGQPTVTPPPATALSAANPYCIVVTDVMDPAVFRSVILFDDGTVKVQKNETWCP